MPYLSFQWSDWAEILGVQIFLNRGAKDLGNQVLTEDELIEQVYPDININTFTNPNWLQERAILAANVRNSETTHTGEQTFVCSDNF